MYDLLETRILNTVLILSRFNVDCAASTGLYAAAEGAFGQVDGAGDDVGECPAPGNKSPEECAGAVSNCWSPGQRDTGQCCDCFILTI